MPVATGKADVASDKDARADPLMKAITLFSHSFDLLLRALTKAAKLTEFSRARAVAKSPIKDLLRQKGREM